MELTEKLRLHRHLEPSSNQRQKKSNLCGFACQNGEGSSAASSANWKRCNTESLKTLQEPKTGPLEPFEIADLFQYLLLYQQLASMDLEKNVHPPPGGLLRL
jgi:hypothetical protein